MNAIKGGNKFRNWRTFDIIDIRRREKLIATPNEKVNKTYYTTQKTTIYTTY
jgi:hypothetical protein